MEGLIVLVGVIVCVVMWVLYMNKTHTPENAKKVQQEREKVEKQREEERVKARKYREEEQSRRKEAERLRTTVVATKLIGEGTAEYKRSAGSMVVRGAVGSLFGPMGTVVGMASTKSKNTNKDVRRFLVKYLDGHIEEKEATIGSAKYKEYMKYLVWEENDNEQ